MNFSSIIIEAFTGSLENVFQIALIVIPFMLFIEIFRDLNLLEKLTAFISPLTRFIGVSSAANLPLLAGMVFGISYGAGVIISSAREGKLSINEIYFVNLFLVICHSIFEDTLLFAAIGAKWLPILISRFMLAIVITYFWSRYKALHRTNSLLKGT